MRYPRQPNARGEPGADQSGVATNHSQDCSLDGATEEGPCEPTSAEVRRA